MVIIMGILFMLVDAAVACLFVDEHMFSPIRSIYVGMLDPLFLATNLDRSDMFIDALQL